MDVIKQWALSACAAVIVGALVNMMTPNGKFEKVMKLTISTFFLCCLFSPFILQSPALSFDVDAYFANQTSSYASELEQQTDEQLYDQFRVTLREYIEKSLADIEIEANIIDIQINEDATDTTEIIQSISLTLFDDYEREDDKIRQTVKDITALEDDAIRIVFE